MAEEDRPPVKTEGIGGQPTQNRVEYLRALLEGGKWSAEELIEQYRISPEEMTALFGPKEVPLVSESPEGVQEEAPPPAPHLSLDYQPYTKERGDSYTYYCTYLLGETRGMVQILDPNLYSALRRSREWEKIPLRELYGSDPVDFARVHYPDLSAGQIAQVNPALYQYLYRRDLHLVLERHRAGEPQLRQGQEGVRKPYWAREAKAWAIIVKGIEQKAPLSEMIAALNREGFSSLRDKSLTKDIMFEEFNRVGLKLSKREEALVIAQQRLHEYGDLTEYESHLAQRALAGTFEEGVRWHLHPVPWALLRRAFEARQHIEKRGVVPDVFLTEIATALSKHGFVPVEGTLLSGQILERALQKRFGPLSKPETHAAIITHAAEEAKWLTIDDRAMLDSLFAELYPQENVSDAPLPPPTPTPEPIKEKPPRAPLTEQYLLSFAVNPEKLFVFYEDGRRTADRLTPDAYIDTYLRGAFEWQQKKQHPPYDYPAVFPKKGK